MRQDVIESVKTEIEALLKDYLRDEGIDRLPGAPQIELEGIEDLPLEGGLLYWEICVILGIFGKRWQCDGIADGIYRALAAHRPTAAELTTILTSLHLEATKSKWKRRAVLRYILTED